MKFYKYIFITIFLLYFGCAKTPDRIESAGIKIDVINEDNKELFALRFSGGIKNENPGTAITDYKGNAVFIDPGKNRAAVKSFGFSLPVVLPFDSSIIDVKVTIKEEEIAPLIKLLGIDMERLKKEKSIEKFDLDEKSIELQNISFNKKCITDLLKEKLNEKN